MVTYLDLRYRLTLHGPYMVSGDLKRLISDRTASSYVAEIACPAMHCSWHSWRSWYSGRKRSPGRARRAVNVEVSDTGRSRLSASHSAGLESSGFRETIDRFLARLGLGKIICLTRLD